MPQARKCKCTKYYNIELGLERPGLVKARKSWMQWLSSLIDQSHMELG